MAELHLSTGCEIALHIVVGVAAQQLRIDIDSHHLQLLKTERVLAQ